MSIEALKWAFEQTDVPPQPRFTLVALANRADDEGFCFPSIKWISRKTGYSDSTVRGHLEDLRKWGKLAKTERRREDGGRSSNEYQLALTQPGLALTPPPESGGTPPNAGGAPHRKPADPPPDSGGHKTKIQTKTVRQKALLPELPDFIPRKEWDAYEADRRERGKKLTSRARELALEDLAQLHKAGQDLKAVIRQTIASGWSSFHAIRAEKPNGAAGGSWWTSDEGISRKGAELGLKPRSTESYGSYRDRIFQHLDGMKAPA